MDLLIERIIKLKEMEEEILRMITSPHPIPIPPHQECEIKIIKDRIRTYRKLLEFHESNS